MKTICRVVGVLLWIGSGLLMFFFWFTAMSKWLGLIGSILAFVLTPGVIIFPIVFWVVEGIFPLSYFIIWGIGILGMLIVGLTGD